MLAKELNASLLAGMLSGLAGLLGILTIHHLWIRPIWFIALPGGIIACLGGLAVGWAYVEVRSGLPPRPWTALAVFVLVAATLLPAAVLAQLRPPPLDIRTGAVINGGSGWAVFARFVLELLLTATAVGGLAGWWLGGTSRAAVALALAGFVFALGPGHNLPFLGNTPAAGKGLALLAAIIAISAVVLVEAEAWLAAR